MSADRDSVPDIVFDMEDDLGLLEAHVKAFITLTGKYDGDGAVPYLVCIVLSEGLLQVQQRLKERWQRLFELTRPDNVSRLPNC